MPSPPHSSTERSRSPSPIMQALRRSQSQSAKRDARASAAFQRELDEKTWLLELETWLKKHLGQYVILRTEGEALHVLVEPSNVGDPAIYEDPSLVAPNLPNLPDQWLYPIGMIWDEHMLLVGSAGSVIIVRDVDKGHFTPAVLGDFKSLLR